jgi:3-oxoacyl-ACP reductase-like protein
MVSVVWRGSVAASDSSSSRRCTTTAYNQKVAVITGASQGVGAGLIDTSRKGGYAVVATSGNIAPSVPRTLTSTNTEG